MNPGTFLEVGAGRGVLAHLLLGLGWSGTGYDLNPEAADGARQINAEAVATGRFDIKTADWLNSGDHGVADLVLSSMVLEHLDEEQVTRYFQRTSECLIDGGVGILLVPGSPSHWGIDDEIAGHYRRYTTETLSAAIRRGGFEVRHIAGLAFPVSNLLHRLSNRQVLRAEGARVGLSMEDRTRLSGNREVPWKTTFPAWTRLVLNDATMWPFDLLQRMGSRSEKALILYCEFIRSK